MTEFVIPKDAKTLGVILCRLCYERSGMQEMMLQEFAQVLKAHVTDGEISDMLRKLTYRHDCYMRRARDNFIWEAQKP